MKVCIGDADNCWHWLGGTQSSGYGRYCDYLTHRVSYFLSYLVDPGSFLVCHTCDNRVCCNPLHLFLGTAADNSMDMRNKGRQQRNIGANASRAVLSESDVIAIRLSHKPYTALAEEYGVSYGAVIAAASGRNWSYLETPVQPRRHLTTSDVSLIRQSNLTGRQLARQHGVSEGTISMIRNRKIWQHV